MSGGQYSQLNHVAKQNATVETEQYSRLSHTTRQKAKQKPAAAAAGDALNDQEVTSYASIALHNRSVRIIIAIFWWKQSCNNRVLTTLLVSKRLSVSHTCFQNGHITNP